MVYWDENPFYRPRNRYGGRDPITGAHKDFYRTPEVRDDPDNPNALYGEWERFLTRNGYGGFDRRAQLARGMFDRAQAGFDSAQLSNPGVTWRRYLRTLDGYLQSAIEGFSPQERGMFQPGQTRVIRS